MQFLYPFETRLKTSIHYFRTDRITMCSTGSTSPLFIVSIGISNHTLKGGTYPYGQLREVPHPTPPLWIYLQWTTTGSLFIVSIGISNHTLKGGTYPYGQLREVPHPTPPLWIYLQWTTTGSLFIVSIGISNHTLKGGTYPYGHLREEPHPTPLDIPAVYHDSSFIYC